MKNHTVCFRRFFAPALKFLWILKSVGDNMLNLLPFVVDRSMKLSYS